MSCCNMSGTEDDPMDGSNSACWVERGAAPGGVKRCTANSHDDRSSKPNADSSEATPGTPQMTQPSQSVYPTQGYDHTGHHPRSQARRNKQDSVAAAPQLYQGGPPGYSYPERGREPSSELGVPGPNFMQEGMVGQGTVATGNAYNEPSSHSNGGSSEATAGKVQTTKSSPSHPSSQEDDLTCHQGRSKKWESEESSVDPAEASQQKKHDAAEIKRVLEELKPELQPQYLKTVERWMKKNGIEPKELLEVLKSRQKETKPSLSSYLPLPSWNPFSSVSSLHYVVTGQTFGAHKVIISQLKIKQLKVTELTPTNQHQCQSIILFCPITSRAGSDVEAAMRNPTVAATNKQIFLVLLHHTRDVDYSTAGRRCAEKFPRVLSEFHVLFHETQNGFFKCEQNSMAIHELRQAICAQFGLS